MSTEVVNNRLRSRWEAWVEGELAGVAAYELADGVVTFTHTAVGDGFEGQGIGSALARAALDDARAEGLVAVPRCPFIASWIDHHPDYAGLVGS